MYCTYCYKYTSFCKFVNPPLFPGAKKNPPPTIKRPSDCPVRRAYNTLKTALLLLSELYRGYSVSLLEHSVEMFYIFITDLKGDILDGLVSVFKKSFCSLKLFYAEDVLESLSGLFLNVF